MSPNLWVYPTQFTVQYMAFEPDLQSHDLSWSTVTFLLWLIRLTDHFSFAVSITDGHVSFCIFDMSDLVSKLGSDLQDKHVRLNGSSQIGLYDWTQYARYVILLVCWSINLNNCHYKEHQNMQNDSEEWTYSDFQNWFNVLHFLIVC